MIADLPTILGNSPASSTYALGNLGAPLSSFTGTATTALNMMGPMGASGPAGPAGMAQLAQQQRNRRMIVQAEAQEIPEEDPMADKNQTQRRVVQVFIADPDENVPLDQALIYTGEQKLTDLTDQELFFEIDIRNLLAAHNEKRVKLINKKVKDRTEQLEPARVRDLRMVVVSVATF